MSHLDRVDSQRQGVINSPDPGHQESEDTSMKIEELPLLGQAPESLETRIRRAEMATVLFGEEAPDVMKIGRFVLMEELGAGGQGVVYKADDPELERRVALKRLTADAPGHQERLRKEGRALARVAHPNVVQIFEVGEDETDRPYLVMELVKGRSLDQWLTESPRHWTEVVEQMAAVGDGLAAIHDAGVLHRDIKPHNIVMQDDGTAKLIDLGIAVLDVVGDAGVETNTVGTVGYIAPERYEGQLDARSDQYALCVTLYEALHGMRPPLAMTQAESVEPANSHHRRRRRAQRLVVDDTKPGGAPPTAAVGIEDAPGRLRDVLARGMQEDPQRRYADVRELVAALRDTLPRPRRWPMLALAGVVVVGAGIGMGVVGSGGRASDPCDVSSPARTVWSDAVREDVRAAFVRADESEASRAFTAVNAILTDETDALDRRWTHACLLPGDSNARSLEVADLQSKHAMLGAIVGSVAASEGSSLPNVPVRLAAEVTRLRPSGRRDACEQTEVMLDATPLLAQVEDVSRRAVAEGIAGRYEAALALATEALDLTEGQDVEPVRARLRLERGRLALDAVRTEQALDDLDQARSQAEVLGCDGLGAQALTLYARAQLIAEHGDVQRADQASRLALEKLARTGIAGTRRAAALKSRGFALQRKGALEEAVEHYREALDIWAASDPPAPLDTTDTMLNLAVTKAHLGERDEAIAILREAIAIREAALWPEHPSMYKLHASLSYRLLGRGDLVASTVALSRALDLATTGLGAEHPRVATLHIAMARVLDYQHEFDEALRHAMQADGILVRAHGERDLRRIDALEAIGEVHMDASTPALAIPVLERALEIQAESTETTAWDLVIGRSKLAMACARNDDPERALLLYEEVHRVVEADPSRGGDPLVPEILAGWGEALVLAERHADAVEPLTKAEAWWSQRKTNPDRLARTRWWLVHAKCVTAPEDAAPLARAALEYFASAATPSAKRVSDEISDWLEHGCSVAR